jgi:hypothetical protein
LPQITSGSGKRGVAGAKPLTSVMRGFAEQATSGSGSWASWAMVGGVDEQTSRRWHRDGGGVTQHGLTTEITAAKSRRVDEDHDPGQHPGLCRDGGSRRAWRARRWRSLRSGIADATILPARSPGAEGGSDVAIVNGIAVAGDPSH